MTWSSILGESFLIALGLITFLGNLSTLLAFVIKKSLRSNPSYWYLASLAIADGLVGLLAFPASVYDEFHRDPHDKQLCDVIAYCIFISVIPTYILLTMVSVDRYFKLISPLKYIKHMNVARAKLANLAAWCVAMALAGMFLLSNHTFQDSSCIALKLGDGTEHQTSAFTYWTTLVFVQHLPVCLLIYLNCHIYRVASTVKRMTEREITVSDPFKKVELRIHRGRVIIETAHSTSSSLSTRNTETPCSPVTSPVGIFSTSSSALNCITVTSPLAYETTTSAPGSPSGRDVKRSLASQGKLFTFQSQNENHFAIKTVVNLSRKKRNHERDTLSDFRVRKLCDWLVYGVKQRKLSILISVIVIAAALCWVPSSAIYMIKWYCKECTWSRETWVSYLNPWPLYFNSTMNPFILLFMSEDFRKAYRQLYNRILRCNNRKNQPFN